MIASYHEAHELAAQLFRDVYQVTEGWPQEFFGMIVAIRRAAMTIPTILSEGANQVGSPEARAYIHDSQQLLMELQSHLQAAQANPALWAANLEALLEQTARLSKALLVLA